MSIDEMAKQMTHEWHKLSWVTRFNQGGEPPSFEQLAKAGVLAGLQKVEEVKAALLPLKLIADAFDANELDAEARKSWGKNDEHHNTTDPAKIELYQGRGGRELLTLAQCFAARTVYESLR